MMSADKLHRISSFVHDKVLHVNWTGVMDLLENDAVTVWVNSIY